MRGDLCLLQLESEHSCARKSIQLPTLDSSSRTRSAKDSTATAAGWGRLAFNGAAPDVMQEVDLPLVDRVECNKAASYDGDVLDDVEAAVFEL
eukprot:6671809-Prymnesium_polylepis.2